MVLSRCVAQDSLVQSMLPDSLVNLDDLEKEQVDDYMAEGYFDKVPYFEGVPAVDTTLFSQLSAAYKKQEFDYENENLEQIGFFKKIGNRLARWLGNLFPDTQYFNFADIVYNILAVAAVLLLVWILYRVIFSGKRLLHPNEEEASAQSEIKFVERNLMDVDLMRYIEEAKQQDDFAKAIRYLNLLNIQLLARKGYIHWRHSKSNVELIEEIEHRDIKAEFAQNVDLFNRIWYGNEPIDKGSYERLANYFLHFQTKWQ